jgi:5-formyltetrahydrofolate cyclo-ligase
VTLSNDPPGPDKRALRSIQRARRAERPQADREAFARRLVEVDRPELRSASSVTLFVGVGDEPDTSLLLHQLHERGVRVLLPIVQPDWSLDWAVYVGDDALTGAGYGLLEPTGPRLGAAAIAEVDVVLAPALAIDPAGRRLGQGAGCYDRALSFVPPETPILAIVYPDERLDSELPEEPHDRRVTGVFV